MNNSYTFGKNQVNNRISILLNHVSNGVATANKMAFQQTRSETSSRNTKPRGTITIYQGTPQEIVFKHHSKY
jgi:hypothetical protein